MTGNRSWVCRTADRIDPARVRRAFCRRPHLTRLLNTKLVHTGECVRVFVLTSLPLTKVSGGGIMRETQLIGMKYIAVDSKPQKRKIILPEKCINAGQQHAMFLNMEK